MLTPSGETSGWETRPLGTMSPSVLHMQGTRAILMLREFGVPLPASNRLEIAVELLSRVHKSGLIPSVSTPELNAKILAAMRAVHEAVTVLEARRSLSIQGHPFTQSRLQLLVEGPLETKPGTFDDAANRRFETVIASLMALGGIGVSAGEPDWRIRYFDEQLGVAVKRLNATTTMAAAKLIRKGAHQIRHQGMRGIVVLNVEHLINELPGNLSAAEYGECFNAKLVELHEYMDTMVRYPAVIAVLLTGIVGRWAFGADGSLDLHWSHPFQLVGFSDIEPAERFDQYFSQQFAPRYRNALKRVAAIVGP